MTTDFSLLFVKTSLIKPAKTPWLQKVIIFKSIYEAVVSFMLCSGLIQRNSNETHVKPKGQ